MKRIVKIVSIILSLICILAAFPSCSNGKYSTKNTGKGTSISMVAVKKEINSKKAEDFEETDKKTDYVKFKIKDYGEIVVVLRTDVAPITVKNFKKLVADGFYNGLIFHRVMENFMIQGGGFDESFKQKEADAIKGEFSSNSVTNNLTHVRGVISMARTEVKDSASSQFFIMHKDYPSLNGEYAAFGYVLAGMEVVDAIATCPVTGSANAPIPVTNVVIESAVFVVPK